jgi:hypothetical protein
MLFFRFSILFFIIPGMLWGFSDEACLKEDFKTKVVHKAWPFGLFENEIKISKNLCLLEITGVKYRVFKKKWSIDICRLPIHIKHGVSAVDVYKREGACPPYDAKNITGDFCLNLAHLEKLILDEGLIFAEGFKEDLVSSHGKVYCTYLLLQGYLREGIVYGSQSKWIKPKNEIGLPKVKAIEVQPQVPQEPASPLENF